jgi:hypothetical protein
MPAFSRILTRFHAKLQYPISSANMHFWPNAVRTMRTVCRPFLQTINEAPCQNSPRFPTLGDLIISFTNLLETKRKSRKNFDTRPRGWHFYRNHYAMIAQSSENSIPRISRFNWRWRGDSTSGVTGQWATWDALVTAWLTGGWSPTPLKTHLWNLKLSPIFRLVTESFMFTRLW